MGIDFNKLVKIVQDPQFSQLSVKDKEVVYHEIASREECASNAIIDLSFASLKLESHHWNGHLWAYLGSTFAFLTTTVASFLRLVTNVVVMALAAPVSIFSSSGSRALGVHAKGALDNLLGVSIGTLGTISPHLGRLLTNEVATKILENRADSL